MQLPEELLNSISARTDFDRRAFTDAHDNTDRVTSIRLNPFKPADFDVLHAGATAVPWCDTGYYLHTRPSFTGDPFFHAGCYYVQEAGSMFIGHALRQLVQLDRPLAILDLCAAPGGKTTHLASLAGSDSVIVSNEIIKSRAGTLWLNASKWGTSNVVVTNHAPKDLEICDAYFDVIVVDAPCSGSGLFRKQPEALEEWSPHAVQMCAVRQKDILDSAVRMLKPGGTLVYSTCSYSYEENEDVVQWLISSHEFSVREVQLPDAGIVRTQSGYRFYPHLTESEGFFCSVLVKGGESGETSFGAVAPARIPAAIGNWVDAADHAVTEINGVLHMMGRGAADFYARYGRRLFLRKAGTALGEIKGKDFVPSQELAWSIHLSEETPRVELGHAEALRYLRRENFALPEGSPAGLALVTYGGHGLGWAKVMERRVNNYLPSGLRIMNVNS